MANTSSGNPVTPLSSGPRRCPICRKPAVARHQPFCSKRCADIDLGRWLKGNYSIPTDEAPEDAPEGASGDDEER